MLVEHTTLLENSCRGLLIKYTNYISHNVALASDIALWIKTDKGLVVYIFKNPFNHMTSRLGGV